MAVWVQEMVAEVLPFGCVGFPFGVDGDALVIFRKWFSQGRAAEFLPSGHERGGSRKKILWRMARSQRAMEPGGWVVVARSETCSAIGL